MCYNNDVMSQRPPFRRPEPPPPCAYPANLAEYRQAMQSGPDAVRQWCARVDAEEIAAGDDRPGPKYLIALAHFAQVCAGVTTPDFENLPAAPLLALCESRRFAAARDTMRNRPIHLAAGSRHGAEMARVLVRSSPECASMPNSRSQVAAHVAAGYGAPSVMKAIVAARPESLNSIDSASCTPAFAAARNGRLENLSAIIANAPESLSRLSSAHQNALHAAVLSRSPECVDLLLKTRPELAYETDEDGMTPLALNALQTRVDANETGPKGEQMAERRLAICDALLAAAPDTIAIRDYSRRPPAHYFGGSSEHPVGKLLWKRFTAHVSAKARDNRDPQVDEPAPEAAVSIEEATAAVDRIGAKTPTPAPANDQLDLF